MTRQAGTPHAARRAAWLGAAIILVAGCTTDRLPSSPPVETADDFIGALRRAGATVDETAMLPLETGFVGGQVILIDDQAVEIFEYPSRSDRDENLESLLDLPLADPPPAVWSARRILVLYHGSDGATIALISGLLGDEIGLPGPDTHEPYPPAVTAAISWLSERQEADPGLIRVLDYDSAEWSDACLGMGGPDEVCALMLTLGWEIRLELDGAVYRLRSDTLGTQIRLE